MFCLYGYIKAPLVIVRCGLPIIKSLELLGHSNVLLEALLDVAFLLECFSLLEDITKLQKRIFSLLESLLSLAFVQSLLLLQTNARLYFAGSSICCHVEEVDIRL